MSFFSSFGRRAFFFVAAVAMVFPSPSLAARPSDVLAQALINSQKEKTGELHVEFTGRFTLVGIPYSNLTLPSPLTVKALLTSRALPSGSDLSNTEGRLLVQSVKFDRKLPGYPGELVEPVAFQWKVVDSVAYFRVEKLSEQILGFSKLSDSADFTKFVGRWMKVDLSDARQAMRSTNLGFGPLSAQEMLGLKEEVTNPMSFVKVMGVKKADNLLAFDARLQPSLIAKLEREARTEAAKLTKQGAFGKTMARNHLAEWMKTKALLNTVRLRFLVDPVASKLVRMEVGMRGTEPKTAQCTYNRAGKEVCKQRGTLVYALNIGSSTLNDVNGPIVAPSGAMTMEELMKELYPSLYTEPKQELIAPPVPEQPSADTSTLRPVEATDHVRGAPDAKVTMIEYSDFQCPFCARHEATVLRALSEYPLDVRLVYRHFPLSFHAEAEKAAEASECAGQQGKFWEMHDLIFDANEAGTMSVQRWKDDAKTLGLNTDVFNACLDSGAMAARVNRDGQGGEAAGVGAVPTMFVNGVRVEGALPYENLKAAIETALGR